MILSSQEQKSQVKSNPCNDHVTELALFLIHQSQKAKHQNKQK